MTNNDQAVIKAERRWAIKLVAVLMGIIAALLITMWGNLGVRLDELQSDMKGLRCEVQDIKFTGVTERSGLSNRITRIETRLDIP